MYKYHHQLSFRFSIGRLVISPPIPLFVPSKLLYDFTHPKVTNVLNCSATFVYQHRLACNIFLERDAIRRDDAVRKLASRTFTHRTLAHNWYFIDAFLDFIFPAPCSRVNGLFDHIRFVVLFL